MIQTSYKGNICEIHILVKYFFLIKQWYVTSLISSECWSYFKNFLLASDFKRPYFHDTLIHNFPTWNLFRRACVEIILLLSCIVVLNKRIFLYFLTNFKEKTVLIELIKDRGSRGSYDGELINCTVFSNLLDVYGRSLSWIRHDDCYLSLVVLF